MDEEIGRKIARIIAVEGELEASYEEMAGAKSLGEIGLDSLGIIDVIFAVERELSISIPDQMLRGVKSFGDLVKVVEAAIKMQEAVPEPAGNA